jgi:teichuronic acid biosynthesis glycosyltransferase TuaC
VNGLRVLHVTNMFPSPEAPGAGAFVENQVRSLRSSGVDCDVHIIRAGHYASAARDIRRATEHGRYDLVHAHYGLSGWAALWQPLPLVVTFAGSDLYGMRRGSVHERWKGRAEVLVSHWAAFGARRIIVMSRWMIDLLRFRALRAKARVLPYGIETGRLRPGLRDTARAKLGLDRESVIVFWPHRPSPVKRRDLAEAAVRRAEEILGRPVVLWQPPLAPQRELGLRYQAADCLLIVSDTEGSPNVVKEALSVAIPVVGVDVGDVWQWIGDVPWCRRVARDVEAIAHGLVGVAQAPRPEAPPPCVAEFDVSVVARHVVAVYQDTLA